MANLDNFLGIEGFAARNSGDQDSLEFIGQGRIVFHQRLASKQYYFCLNNKPELIPIPQNSHNIKESKGPNGQRYFKLTLYDQVGAQR